MNFSEEQKQRILRLCVLTKTSEDIYVTSFKDGENYQDFASIKGYPVPYRIFSMLLLKAVFYNFRSSKWEEAEAQLEELWRYFDLPLQPTGRSFIFLLTALRKKFKQISEDSSLDEVKEFIKTIEQRFCDAREEADKK